MSAPVFTLAVPSKGRLQENAAAFFARAGLDVVQGRGARDYRGQIAGLPGVEIAFLSAGEVTQQIAAGGVHMGVTGEDLIRETIPDADARALLLAPLGFGHARVVVAAPRAWIDVRTMADLEDVAAAFRARRGQRMRVATKYPRLTRAFFERHGVADYRIVESLGATEGAPAAGAAELIVDITTTGATLEANALKILDDGSILESQAHLVASRTAAWTPDARACAHAILARIAAEEEARLSREVRARLPAPPVDLLARAKGRFGARAPFGPPRDGLVHLHCPTARVPELADWLIAQGATHVAATELDTVFRARNPLSAALDAALGAG